LAEQDPRLKKEKQHSGLGGSYPNSQERGGFADFSTFGMRVAEKTTHPYQGRNSTAWVGWGGGSLLDLGSLECLLGLFGGLWDSLGLFGALWGSLGLFGALWGYLGQMAVL